MTATTQAAAPARSSASLRHRLAERGIDPLLLLVVPAALLTLALFVYPFAYGIGLTFQPTERTADQWGGGALANYVAFFGDSFVRDSVWITMRLALPAALFNVVASLPIAMVLRRKFRGKRLMTSLLVLPITLGTVLTAQGLLIFAGRQGWINRFLLGTGLVDEPLRLVNNYFGVMLSLVITGFPFAFLLVSSYLSGIDPTLEAAARTLGAGWVQRFRRITLPLLAPGLATTFVLTFVLAFSVFPSARLVGDPGGATRVMALMAYRSFAEQLDYPMASTIALLMGVVELVVVAVVFAWRSLLYKGSTGGKG